MKAFYFYNNNWYNAKLIDIVLVHYPNLFGYFPPRYDSEQCVKIVINDIKNSIINWEHFVSGYIYFFIEIDPNSGEGYFYQCKIQEINCSYLYGRYSNDIEITFLGEKIHDFNYDSNIEKIVNSFDYDTINDWKDIIE